MNPACPSATEDIEHKPLFCDRQHGQPADSTPQLPSEQQALIAEPGSQAVASEGVEAQNMPSKLSRVKRCSNLFISIYSSRVLEEEPNRESGGQVLAF